jgi:hypothetical protein
VKSNLPGAVGPKEVEEYSIDWFDAIARGENQNEVKRSRDVLKSGVL